MESYKKAPLARFTTLKVGGEADLLCIPETTEELTHLLEDLEEKGTVWRILGGGSNLLIASSGVEGTVIRTTQLTNMTCPEPGVIEAEAGARLPHLCRFALKHGLSGLEFAVGIPGTVGGGVVMNAGAHGSDISEHIESATVFDSAKQSIITIPAADLNFAYRTSAINPSTQTVLSARFRLTPARHDQIEAAMRHNEEYRWKTQPLSWPNGGSTFKNPDPERGAGYLLDQAGAKDLRVGEAAVSAVHANFVINMGGAQSGDVTRLLREMQQVVRDKFDVKLKPEWKKFGLFSGDEEAIWNGEG